jgi:hypothetical protein
VNFVRESKLAAHSRELQAGIDVVKSDLHKCALAMLRKPAWISFTCFGMTAGLSMLATPVRFSAETVTRPVVLELGKLLLPVFAGFRSLQILREDAGSAH